MVERHPNITIEAVNRLQDQNFELQDRLKELNEKLIKLEQFYRAVADLTLRHDVLNGYAVVYPSNLGPLLESVNSEWWKR